MERNKTYKKHSNDDEDLDVDLFLGDLASAPCSHIWLVQFSGNERIAYDDNEKINPENDLTDIIDYFMPDQTKLWLQKWAFLHGLVTRPPVGQNHVRQGDQEHEGPDDDWEDLGAQEVVGVGRLEGPGGLLVAIDGYQSQEWDADVHREVEDDGGHLAHEGPQGSCSQLSVAEDFEWKRQNHEEIGDDGVLEENDEVGLAADLKEHPHGQAVGDKSHEKQRGVEEREERLGDPVVSAALAAVPGRGAEVVHGASRGADGGVIVRPLLGSALGSAGDVFQETAPKKLSCLILVGQLVKNTEKPNQNIS